MSRQKQSRALGCMRILAAISLLFGPGLPSLRAADTHYVSLNGGNQSPYVNGWAGAATQIQWAIDASAANDTVLVSNGVYVLTNRVEITSAIILKGFSGDPKDTVIDGNYPNITNRCLLLSNSAAFVSGLTLSNGAWLATASDQGGGGARIFSGTMSNCIVRNNRFFQTLAAGTYAYTGGGGIYMDGGTVTVCTIHANISTNGKVNNVGAGAGIFLRNAGSLVSGCIISNNIFSGTNGEAAGTGAFGGGVYMYNGAVLESSRICNNSYLGAATRGFAAGVFMDAASTMRGCTVTLNQAAYGAGVKATGSTITNCVISYNTAEQYGGAVYMTADNYIYNTLILGNTSGGSGTANIYIHTTRDGGTAASQVKIDNCRIINNRPSGYSAVGVGAGTNISLLNSEVSSNGLGVHVASGTSANIRNCLIVGNSNNASSRRGGGVFIEGPVANVSISGCTIAGNKDKDATAAGAGVRFSGSNISTDVSSCIIYSNGIGGLDDVYDAASPTNINALQYSCVGINQGFTGAGIIVAGPQFKDFAGGNYRLANNSPCVNKGLNQSWMTNAVDLDGRKRIYYGTVDMGAYEVLNKGTIYGLR